MNRKIKKIINSAFLIPLLILFTGKQINAQLIKESGVNIGIKMGGSTLLSERSENQSIKEFSNKSGLATGIEISKVVSPHFELGTDFIYHILNGETDQTDHFSAIGFHAAFPEPLAGSTEYNNKLTGQNFFFRYYLKDPFTETYFNPFIKIGFGYLSYKSTFRYADTQEIIFGKGDENYADLSTGMLATGAGFKTKLSNQIYLITSIDFNFVKYDFFDVVHNYDLEGNRKNVTGMYSVISAGIYYNASKSNINSGSNKKKRRGSGDPNHLPFGR